MCIRDRPNFKLKRIEVLPGQRLSYQYHFKRQEAWTIVPVSYTHLDVYKRQSITFRITHPESSALSFFSSSTFLSTNKHHAMSVNFC